MLRGYGDADPSNVSSLVRGAEMRVARDSSRQPGPAQGLRHRHPLGRGDWDDSGSSWKASSPKGEWKRQRAGPKVRDRLCQLIRQYKLDPELVKAYAVDFCGTKTPREATREQVENFVQQLDWAEKDRNALLCQLNSYSHPKQEVVAWGAKSLVSPKLPEILVQKFLTGYFWFGLMARSSAGTPTNRSM
jgi:hypothetical protein